MTGLYHHSGRFYGQHSSSKHQYNERFCSCMVSLNNSDGVNLNAARADSEFSRRPMHVPRILSITTPTSSHFGCCTVFGVLSCCDPTQNSFSKPKLEDDLPFCWVNFGQGYESNPLGIGGLA
jgi:hypothetical protein